MVSHGGGAAAESTMGTMKMSIRSLGLWLISVILGPIQGANELQ